MQPSPDDRHEWEGNAPVPSPLWQHDSEIVYYTVTHMSPAGLGPAARSSNCSLTPSVMCWPLPFPSLPLFPTSHRCFLGPPP